MRQRLSDPSTDRGDRQTQAERDGQADRQTGRQGDRQTSGSQWTPFVAL